MDGRTAVLTSFAGSLLVAADEELLTFGPTVAVPLQSHEVVIGVLCLSATRARTRSSPRRRRC